MNPLNIKDLVLSRKEKGITQADVAKHLQISTRQYMKYENEELRPKDYVIEKIAEYIRSEQSSANKVPRETNTLTFAPSGKFPKKISVGDLIPFYDVDFVAGDIDMYDSGSITPAYNMDIPEFSGCTAFRTYNDSMEPLIKSGSILFGTKEEEWQEYLEYGQIFGIVCHGKPAKKYLKYIRKSTREDAFLLKSENKQNYDDMEMPKKKIRSVWLIHGWINKRA